MKIKLDEKTMFERLADDLKLKRSLLKREPHLSDSKLHKKIEIKIELTEKENNPSKKILATNVLKTKND